MSYPTSNDATQLNSRAAGYVLFLASFMFVLRLVPETRGKTLEEIQETWER